MVHLRAIAAGFGFLAAAILSGQSATAAPVIHHPQEASYHAQGGDSDGPRLSVRVTRSRELSALDLGQIMKGPPLHVTGPLLPSPGMGPPPHRCQLGQYPVNGSCL